jgi:hypothetical protein
MRQLTIRRVPELLGERLDAMSRRSGKSLNTLVLELLSEALGVKERSERLRQYVSWDADDVREFEALLKAQRQVDATLWR